MNAKQLAIEKALLPNMMEGAKQENKLVARAGCMKYETFTDGWFGLPLLAILISLYSNPKWNDP
jgi:hypothetical protein